MVPDDDSDADQPKQSKKQRKKAAALAQANNNKLPVGAVTNETNKKQISEDAPTTKKNKNLKQ